MIKTLIPAFRTDYLEDVFRGLTNQSFKEFEILIADDSPGQKVTEAISSGNYREYTDKLNIKLYAGAKSELGNHNHLLGLWAGSTEFAHVHHDDDYIFPDFYRQHVTAHENMDVAITVSSRWLSDETGMPKYFAGFPAQLEESNDRLIALKPSFVAGTTLVPCRNWLGEFSSMLLSKRILQFAPSLTGWGDGYGGILDMSLYMRNAQYGFDLGYIRDHLGVYRAQFAKNRYKDPNNRSGQLHRFWWPANAARAWKDQLLSEVSFQQSVAKFLDRYLTEQPENPHYTRLNSRMRSTVWDSYAIAELIEESNIELLR